MATINQMRQAAERLRAQGLNADAAVLEKEIGQFGATLTRRWQLADAAGNREVADRLRESAAGMGYGDLSRDDANLLRGADPRLMFAKVLGKAAQPDEIDGMPNLAAPQNRVLAGAGMAPPRAALGLMGNVAAPIIDGFRKLFGQGDGTATREVHSDIDYLQQLEVAAGLSGATRTGSVLGDVAMFALPGSAGAKALTRAGKGAGARARIGAAARNAGVLAAEGAGASLMMPAASGREAAQNALLGAAAGPALNVAGTGVVGLGRAGRSALEAFRPTVQAQKRQLNSLMRSGLTPEEVPALARVLREQADPLADVQTNIGTAALRGQDAGWLSPEAAQAAVSYSRALARDPQAGQALALQNTANNAARVAEARRLAMLTPDGQPTAARTAAEAERRAVFENAPRVQETIPRGGPDFAGTLENLPKELTDKLNQAQRDMLESARGYAAEGGFGHAMEVLTGQLPGSEAMSGSAAEAVASLVAERASALPRVPVGSLLDDLDTAAQQAVGAGARTKVRDTIQRLESFAKDHGGFLSPAELHGAATELQGVRGPNALGAAERRTGRQVAARNAQDVVVDYLDSAPGGVPGYRELRQRYAEASVPLNDAQPAADLLASIDRKGVVTQGNDPLMRTADLSKLDANNLRAQYRMSPEGQQALAPLRESLALERRAGTGVTPETLSTPTTRAQGAVQRITQAAPWIITGGAAGYPFGSAGMVGGMAMAGVGQASIRGLLDNPATRRAQGILAANPERAASALEWALARDAAARATDAQRRQWAGLLGPQAIPLTN